MRHLTMAQVIGLWAAAVMVILFGTYVLWLYFEIRACKRRERELWKQVRKLRF